MKVTPGDPSCQNATVPGVSILHEMQTLSGGGLAWSAAGSGPAAGTGRTGGAPPEPREIRAKCVSDSSRGAQVYDPPLRWARKCMHGRHGGRASACTAPAELKQVYAPSRQIRVECMFLSPKRNQVHLGGIHLSPRPPARRQRGGQSAAPEASACPAGKAQGEMPPRAPRQTQGVGASKEAAPAPDGEGADAWHIMWAVQ